MLNLTLTANKGPSRMCWIFVYFTDISCQQLCGTRAIGLLRHGKNFAKELRFGTVQFWQNLLNTHSVIVKLMLAVM